MSHTECERCHGVPTTEGLVFVNGRVLCHYHADADKRSAEPVAPPPPTEEEKEAAIVFKYGGSQGYQKYLDRQAGRG